jgi:hypothetical protein
MGLAFEHQGEFKQARKAFTAAARGNRALGDEVKAQEAESYQDKLKDDSA